MKKGNTSIRFILTFMSAMLALGDLGVLASTDRLQEMSPPNQLVELSEAYHPVIMRGVKLDPNDPLRFNFIIDSGDDNVSGPAFNREANRLIKYFLTSLTVPEDDLWVNLSPHESDRIVPDKLGQTEMGIDLLAQDYMLKQITSSLMYPESKTGQAFWTRIREKALERFGTTDIPMNMFNKVWIVPDKAVVSEYKHAAFVAERHLKVMLESDYVASQAFSDQPSAISKGRDASMKHPQYNIAGSSDPTNPSPESPTPSPTLDQELSKLVIKEIILPELEREINEGKTFAKLRQIFNSLILGTWYKQKLNNGVLAQSYFGQNKTVGIEINDKKQKEKIYQQYVMAAEQGVFDFTEEVYDEGKDDLVAHRYFAGGVRAGDTANALTTNDGGDIPVPDGEYREVDTGATEVRPGEEEEGHAYRLNGEGLSPEQNQVVNDAIASFFAKGPDGKTLEDQLTEEAIALGAKIIDITELGDYEGIVFEGRGAKLLYLPTLMEETIKLARERGVTPPDDLVFHLGFSRNQIAADAHMYDKVYKSLPPEEQKQAAVHELTHYLRGKEASEAEVQRTAPVPPPMIITTQNPNQMEPIDVLTAWNSWVNVFVNQGDEGVGGFNYSESKISGTGSVTMPEYLYILASQQSKLRRIEDIRDTTIPNDFPRGLLDNPRQDLGASGEEPKLSEAAVWIILSSFEMGKDGLTHTLPEIVATIRDDFYEMMVELPRKELPSLYVDASNNQAVLDTLRDPSTDLVKLMQEKTTYDQLHTGPFSQHVGPIPSNYGSISFANPLHITALLHYVTFDSDANGYVFNDPDVTTPSTATFTQGTAPADNTTPTEPEITIPDTATFTRGHYENDSFNLAELLSAWNSWVDILAERRNEAVERYSSSTGKGGGLVGIVTLPKYLMALAQPSQGRVAGQKSYPFPTPDIFPRALLDNPGYSLNRETEPVLSQAAKAIIHTSDYRPGFKSPNNSLLDMITAEGVDLKDVLIELPRSLGSPSYFVDRNTHNQALAFLRGLTPKELSAIHDYYTQNPYGTEYLSTENQSVPGLSAEGSTFDPANNPSHAAIWNHYVEHDSETNQLTFNDPNPPQDAPEQAESPIVVLANGEVQHRDTVPADAALAKDQGYIVLGNGYVIGQSMYDEVIADITTLTSKSSAMTMALNGIVLNEKTYIQEFPLEAVIENLDEESKAIMHKYLVNNTLSEAFRQMYFNGLNLSLPLIGWEPDRVKPHPNQHIIVIPETLDLAGYVIVRQLKEIAWD